MPRLHGYAETNKLNVYDAIFNGIAEHDWGSHQIVSGEVRVFGNQNIGQRDLCNLHNAGDNAGDIAGDQTAYIQNWYARTSLPSCSEVDDWAHSSTATLAIGGKTYMTIDLYDLFRRTEGVEFPKGVINPDEGKMVVEDLAKLMFAAYGAEFSSFFSSFDTKFHALSDMPQEVINGWHAAAAAAHRHVNPSGARIIIIPPRQTVEVTVRSHRDTFEHMRRHVLKQKRAARERAWIHLEGFARRDAC